MLLRFVGGLQVIAAMVFLGLWGVPYVNGGAAIVMLLAWLLSKDKPEPDTQSAFNAAAAYRAGVNQALSPLMVQRAPSPLTLGFVSSGQVAWVPTSVTSTYPGIFLSESVPRPVIEDRTEPVYGWRAYKLGEGGVLWGVIVPWPERRLLAVCSGAMPVMGGTLGTSIPGDGMAEVCVAHLEEGMCSCGIYLRAEPEPMGEGYLVYARVLACGVVALDKDGNARASEVQIEALYVVKQLSVAGVYGEVPVYHCYLDWARIATDLHERYGVAVEVVDDLAALRR